MVVATLFSQNICRGQCLSRIKACAALGNDGMAQRVDINSADIDELATLLGIGKARAQAIIRHRENIHGFKNVNELLSVPGVGTNILELNGNRIRCDSVRHQPAHSAHNLRNSSSSSGRSRGQHAPGDVSLRPLTRSREHSKRSSDQANEAAHPASSVSSASVSRLPSISDSENEDSKQVKRKSSFTDDRKASPTKKTCRFFPDDVGRVAPPLSPVQISSKKTDSLPKRRLSARLAPPANLMEWVKTFQHWSEAEKVLAIDELIEKCDPSQVRHIMSVIEPQFQRDFISLLPKELALHVLSFLEPQDILKAAQTCQTWRILCEDNLLWREKCLEADINEPASKMLRRRSHGGVPRSPWKSLYLRTHQIEYNWRHGDIKPPKVLKGHDDHVITCLQFSGQRIVSGSDDNTLKVWSALTGKCLRTLTGHTGGVWSSQMKNNIIVSGSTDRTLRVWNADSGLCIHTLFGHTSTVRCMHLHENKVVSGSRDASLRLWDIDSGACLHVLVGHVAAVRCVQYDGRRVVSGAYDYMVKVWNPETEECLYTLQGHTNRVYSLQYDGVHIVSGSLDTSIRVWEADTGVHRHTLTGHQSLTSGMELKDNILVSGNADSTVKIWDITSGRCLQTLQGTNKHQSAVTSLQFDKKFVITSSDDGTVKLWDLKTGDFIRNLVVLESGGSGGVVWRVQASETKLVCAVGSRNGTEETKLLVLDFDADLSR